MQTQIILKDPIRYCKQCGIRIFRKRWPGGVLETPFNFAKRKCCGPECGNKLKTVPVLERIRRLIKIDPISQCWIWQGCIHKGGYGVITINFKASKLHRVMWTETFGPIPEGLFVLHKCDVKPCCNSDHLFLGTHQDNMDDKVAKGRQGRPQMFGEKNPKSIISDVIRKEIEESTLLPRELSEIYNLKLGTIRSIKRRLLLKERKKFLTIKQN